MTTPHDVYRDLIKAYNKASAASDEWNQLSDAIKQRERIYAENVGLDKVTLGDRITDVKDKARTLKDVFSKYSFWKGEVERHSAMLAGVLAYEQYTKIGTDRYEPMPGQ